MFDLLCYKNRDLTGLPLSRYVCHYQVIYVPAQLPPFHLTLGGYLRSGKFATVVEAIFDDFVSKTNESLRQTRQEALETRPKLTLFLKARPSPPLDRSNHERFGTEIPSVATTVAASGPRSSDEPRLVHTAKPPRRR